MLPYFIELLTLALGSLAVSYGLGAGLLRLAGWRAEEPFYTTFLRLLTGVLTVTTAYALVRTGGVSVLLPVPLLLAVVVRATRRPAAEASSPSVLPRWGGALLLSLGMSVVVFIGQYALVYEPGAAHLQTPFQDHVYYSRLTLMLNQAGLETNSLEMVFPQFQTEQPYHYLEIWLNALLVWATCLPSVWVFFVSMATVLISISGVGLAAIYAHAGLQMVWAAVLGGLTLMVTGIVWPLLSIRYGMVANGALLTHLPIILHPKLAPVYLATVLAVLLLLRRQWLAAAAALAMLPLLVVATAPAAGTGVAGLALYLGMSRQLPWRQALRLLGPMAAAGVYLVLFYALQSAPYRFPVSGHTSLLAAVLPAAGELKTLANIAIGVLVNYGIYYLGYVVLIGLLWWSRPAQWRATMPINWPLLAWATATLLGATLTRTLGHHFLDGFQFFSNIMVPVSAVLVAVLLGQVLRDTRIWWPSLAAGGLLGLLLINPITDSMKNTSFSANFLNRVGPVLQKLPNRGGYLLNDSDYQNAYMNSSDSYTAGNYVSNFKNDYLLISLSSLVPDSLDTDPRFARDSAQAALIKGRSTLFRLAKLGQLAGRPVPADSVELTLVRRAGLAFICASRRARLPAALRPLVRAQYRDERSGEVLYVLRPTEPAPALPLP